MKSELIEYLKQDIRGRFIMEIRVWRVDDKRYPKKMKYSLIFIEQRTKRRVLMDNHYPKRPHIHIDNTEIPYEFSDIGNLFADFRKSVFQHFGEKI